MNPIGGALGEKEAAYCQAFFRCFWDIDPEMFWNLVENKQDNDSCFCSAPQLLVCWLLAPTIVIEGVGGHSPDLQPFAAPPPHTGPGDRMRTREEALPQGTGGPGQF